MTIIKKWKAGRGEQVGVVQVKLKNAFGGGVYLSVVDEDGEVTDNGNMLRITEDGVILADHFKCKGINNSGLTVNVKEENW